MNVSPGLSRPRNTDWFAWLPEFAWTLANWHPKSFFALAMASSSAMSTNWQPP